MHIHLFVIAILEVILPIVALLIIRKIKSYRFAAIIGGVAANFFNSNLLLPLLIMMLAAIGMDELYFSIHPTTNLVIETIASILFPFICLSFIMRFTLKNRARIYDAMALGVAYVLAEGFGHALSNIMSAKSIQLVSQGTLATLTDDIESIQNIEERVSTLLSQGSTFFYIELLKLLSYMFVLIALCLFLYLAMKRKSIKHIAISFIGFSILCLCNNADLYFSVPFLSFCSPILALVLSCIIIWRFMIWYREKQRALAYRRKNYNESLTTTE